MSFKTDKFEKALMNLTSNETFARALSGICSMLENSTRNRSQPDPSSSSSNTKGKMGGFGYFLEADVD